MHNYDLPLHLLYLRLWKWQKSGDMLFAMHQKKKKATVEHSLPIQLLYSQL